MNLDCPQLKTTVQALKLLDFELSYLALLTREGLKPLSRWEKPLDSSGLELLRQIGLLTEQIRRTVKIGKQVTETIFSVSAGYIQLYQQRFDNTPIEKSPAVTRFEGFLFGYPPCCISQYIRRPYTPNDLPPQDQGILFHWACKQCKITPTLLPPYRQIHDYLLQS